MSPCSCRQKPYSQPIPSRSESGPERSTTETAFISCKIMSLPLFFIILPLSGWYPWQNLSTFTVMDTSEPGSSINLVLVYRAISYKACNPSHWIIAGSSHWFSGGLVSLVCQHVQNCGEHAVVQKVYCSRPNANVLVCIHSQRF